MKNVFDYVSKYGRKSFYEKEFNDIDNIVFSLLSYLDLRDLDVNNHSIQEVAKKYFEKNNYFEVAKYGFSQRDAFKVLRLISNTRRYKDIILKDYIYITNNDMQFGVVTFYINKDLAYISFEGTDQIISGYKEDGILACSFPIESHKLALKYVKKHIKILGPNIIIGGHSKGGHLALTCAMYVNFIKRLKIIKVYNNDGPGLRKKQFESMRYKWIKNRYVHFVPNNTMVGILLRNDIYNVVHSNKPNFFSHSMSSWKVDDDKFIEDEMDEFSKKIEKNLISWLDNHNDEQRALMINNLFSVLEKCNINETIDLKNAKNIINIIKELKNIDNETKNITIDFILYNFSKLLDNKQ